MKDRRMWIIFLIIFINLLGFGIILPLLPYYVESLGANALTVGLLSASFSLFQFLSAPILGEISDKYGRRPILLFSIAGTAVSFFLLGAAKTIPMLFLARIIDGASGGNISTAQAYIADITTKEKRSESMGMIGAAFGLGFIFGPALGGVLSQFSYSLPAYVAGAVALLATILTYFYLPETVTVAVEKSELKKKKLFDWSDFMNAITHKEVGNLIVAVFLTNLAFSIMQGTFALFTEHVIKLTATGTGLLFTYIGILSVIVQMVILKIVLKKVKERSVLIISTVLSAMSLALIGASSNVSMLLLSLTILSLGQGLVGPVVMGQISERTPVDEQGNIMGVSQSIASVARLFGPLAGAFIFNLNLYEGPFLLAGIIMLTSVLFISPKVKLFAD